MLLPKQKEDFTTETLATLLRSDPVILQLFLRFLFSDGPQADKLGELPLQVKTQYPTPNGRIDLLIYSQAVGIIVECKVNDGHKIYQLEKYHRFWLRTYNAKPYVFWLVRRKTGPLGLNPYLNTELRWDELYSFFQREARNASQPSVRNKLNAFCDYLRDAEIILGAKEKPVRTKRNLGYDYAYAERLLGAIAAKHRGSVSDVMPPMNSVTHKLLIGRKSWASKFDDDWIQRVSLQFKPSESDDGFFWHGSIMFYDRHHVADPAFAMGKLPEWAPICKDAGFRLLRNLGVKWDGTYNYEITPPYIITKPVKYFFAPLPDKTWPVTIFHPSTEKIAIEEGSRLIQFMYDAVDQFSKMN